MAESGKSETGGSGAGEGSDPQPPDKKEKKSAEAKSTEKPTASGLALKAGEALIPIFITAGSLLGFVAFAGAVVLWTRLEAVQIPAEQAIDVAPQGQLVAIGGVFLLLFGFFGALALMGAFLVDRGARPTPGMARALIVLLAIEGVVAITAVEGRTALETLVDAELFVLPLGIALLVTRIDRFGTLVDDLGRRRRERCEPEWAYGVLRPCETRKRTFVEDRLFVFGPIALIVLATIFAAIVIWRGGSDSLLLWVLAGFAVVFAIWVIALVVHDGKEAGRERERRRKDEVEARAKKDKQGKSRLRRFLRRICGSSRKPADRPQATAEEPATHRCATCGERHECEKGEATSAKTCDEVHRLSLRRPLRLRLTPLGIVLAGASIAIGALLVMGRLGLGDEWWVGVSLAVAALIVAALWRVAELLNKRLVWFGIAVFLSVPLFGTLLTMVKNAVHPKVQAMALIRKTDGPRESIQGLYVTEAGGRVYFANIGTEGCSNDIVPQSGRLLSLPEDEVVAMSLGPLQSVEEAGKTALEMSYALTPSIETPGASVVLAVDEARAKKAEEEADASWNDTRLENAGPAVRPSFGAGLSLNPESASPGNEVTLTMSKPNEEMGGFGSSRAGHNLRIGGVVADIAKERAHRVEGAEFIGVRVGTGKERWIKLDKEGPYVEEGDEHVLLEDAENVGPEAALYARLDDSRIRTVGGEAVDGEEIYVEVSAAGGMATVVSTEKRKVTLAGGRAEGETQTPTTMSLANLSLYRQAWHNDHITFRVPEDAETGVVTVECNQLAGSPLLLVSHAPTARISVQMRANSTGVTLDGRRSSDEDEGDEISRRWRVEGIGRGGRKRIAAQLPPRLDVYSVELTVTDEQGNADTAKLRLLRLPASLFAFDHREPERPKAVKAARRALMRAVRAKPPVAIQLDGHADDSGSTAYNLRLSLERDDELRSRLLPEPEQAEDRASPLPVQELAYGETCPLDPRPGKRPRNRRVDVFVLDEGVTVKPANGCHPGQLKSVRWHPPAPGP